MMAFRCGTYAAPTVTGHHDVPAGLPARPTALFLSSAGTDVLGTTEQRAAAGFGATDGTTQWAVAVSSIYNNAGTVVDATVTARSQHSDTSCLRIIDDAGTIVAEAEFVSFNSDGSITLDWTTVPAFTMEVAFMAWDTVNAMAGVTLVDGDSSNTIDVSSRISNLKVVLGANQFQFADAAISMGWGSGVSTVGRGWSCRAQAGGLNPPDDFRVLANPSGNAYLWSVASSTAVGNGSIEDFTQDTFDVDVSTVNLTVSDQPVGWLAIGDGGDWTTKIDTGFWVPSNNVALGGLCVGRAVLGSDPNQKFTVGWGAWDELDNQFVLMNYLEADASGGASAITSRALYSGRTHTQLSAESTVDGYSQLTGPGAGVSGRPSFTITGTTPQQNVVLWFVYPSDAEQVQACLV